MNYIISLTYKLTLLLQGLDNVSSGALRPLTSDLNTPRIDSYRFSMANLEGE
jgi:amyloid beta A4 precursor protein-binding family B protein 1-interacting protein